MASTTFISGLPEEFCTDPDGSPCHGVYAPAEVECWKQGPVAQGPALKPRKSRRTCTSLAKSAAPGRSTSNLIQVRKVMTGQQSQHHTQGLRPALIVLASALQIRRQRSSPHCQIELTQ